MVDTPLPRTLETPPRTTGNAQQDLPILIDWFWKAYQVIGQAVDYINETVSPSITVVANLPDPEGTTLAQAQQTANDAFSLATTNAGRLDGFIAGTFQTEDTDTGVVVTFADAQVDNNYRVIVQPTGSTGGPPIDALVIAEKSYTAANFTVIMFGTPGAPGISVDWEWQLIRNT